MIIRKAPVNKINPNKSQVISELWLELKSRKSHNAVMIAKIMIYGIEGPVAVFPTK